MAARSDVYAMLDAGNAPEAERLARLEVQQSNGAEQAEWLLPLALALRAEGKLPEALATLEQLTVLHPERVSTWGNYATVLRALGRVGEARAAYIRALDIEPRNAPQWFNLGSLDLQRGDALGARDSLLRAHTLEPALPLFGIVAAHAMCECRDYRAPDMIAPWRDWLPLPDDQQYELALVMQLTDLMQESVGVLEQLVARAPGYTVAQLLLSSAYERVNRLEDAANVLDRVAERAADGDAVTRVEVDSQRATLLARRGKYHDARELFERTGPRRTSDPSHYFQLGRVCDRLGDPAACMRALETAHALQLAELRQSVPQRLEPGTPLLPAAETSVSASEYAAWPQLPAPDAKDSPVFVVGFPRSGTTLVEQMLDAHPKLQSMDERPFLYMLADQLADQGFRVPQDIRTLDQRDCDELRRGYLLLGCSKIERRWGAQLVDKNPLNMLWLPLIHRIFPNARFIFVQRHPCDVALSCYMQEFRSAVLAVMSANLEQVARGYVMALEHWFHHVQVFHPSVLTVRYETLVADPQAETSRIGTFLELDDANSLLHFDARAREKGFIGTPSYAQVIEPINQRAVGHWQQYRQYFEPALAVLRPLLNTLDYSIEQPAVSQ